MQNAVGKPVRGDDFFGREKEQADLWTRLATDDVLLLAPRRVGKTSLMFRLQETANEQQFEAVYVSVAGAQSELAFARKLLAEIAKHGSKKTILSKLKSSRAASFLRRVKKIGIFSTFELELTDEAEGQWALVGEAIVEALSQSGSRWLLLVDELPIFVLALLRADESGERARNFLNWFRTVRQSAGTSSTVRWLLAGSIGLDTVTRRLNLGDTINDLFIYPDFGAFTDDTAREFLRRLAASYSMSFSDDVLKRIFERMEWLLPFHLQVCFADLKALRSKGAPSVADVDSVFEDLLGPAKKSYFDFWRQRLHVELGVPDDGRAVRLLNAIAADSAGATRQTLSGVLSADIADPAARETQLTYLIDVLTGDGYIVRRDERHHFRSSLLREYWRRNVT